MHGGRRREVSNETWFRDQRGISLCLGLCLEWKILARFKLYVVMGQWIQAFGALCLDSMCESILFSIDFAFCLQMQLCVNGHGVIIHNYEVLGARYLTESPCWSGTLYDAYSTTLQYVNITINNAFMLLCECTIVVSVPLLVMVHISTMLSQCNILAVDSFKVQRWKTQKSWFQHG